VPSASSRPASGINVERVRTDNGSCYKSFPYVGLASTSALSTSNQSLQSKTNGKAERFIQTSLRECTKLPHPKTKQLVRIEIADTQQCVPHKLPLVAQQNGQGRADHKHFRREEGKTGAQGTEPSG
jgi:transposase InsO family protein